LKDDREFAKMQYRGRNLWKLMESNQNTWQKTGKMSPNILAGLSLYVLLLWDAKKKNQDLSFK
jgi:hypothetical protein